MPNTDCHIQQKGGVNQIVMLPSHSSKQCRLGAWDALLVIGFLAAFIILVFLLAK